MPRQALLRTGFVDVTKPAVQRRSGAARTVLHQSDRGRGFLWPPSQASRSGFRSEPTRSATRFPARAAGLDERTPNDKYLPFTEMWPCVLIGERKGTERPVIVLAPRSGGFDNPAKPKPVFEFSRTFLEAPQGGRAVAAQRRSDERTRSWLYGIDVLMAPGNPGAAAVSFDGGRGVHLSRVRRSRWARG